jgi:hypothetical protein
MVLMFFGGSAGYRSAPVLAQDDAARFTELVTARDGADSVAGPFSGDLTQVVGSVSTAVAGLSVADFSATATFTNPPGAGTTPWDYGFMFHSTPDTGQEILVDSTGTWYYAPFPEGILESGSLPELDTAPGGTNTLDLIVEGGTALFGVNGQFVARIALLPAVAADVEVGTGFFSNTVEDGRIVSYANFEIWDLPAQSAAPAPDLADLPDLSDLLRGTPASGETQPLTPEPESEPEPAPALDLTPESDPALAATPEPETTVSAEDTETFAALLQSQANAVPLAGPFNANLKEAEGIISVTWANLNVADFHASALVTVPEATSDVPWTAGFVFRFGPEGDSRVSVSSLGQWYYSVGSGGTAESGTVANLATNPGDVNALDLLVEGERGWLGVNGELVATIDLGSGGGAADLGLGAGFYSDQLVDGRVTPFADFVVLELPTGSLGGAADVAADGETFLALLSEVDNEEPAAGPFSGRLVEQTVGSVPRAPAGVTLFDFGVMSTFTNPESPTGTLWDAGFEFRVTDQTNRVVLDSLGDVYVQLIGIGARKLAHTDAYDAQPGASNTLQFFARGDRAYFGVNGEFVAAFDLPPDPVASDVYAGTGWFNEDFSVGRVTDYEDFSVWALT